MAKYCLGEVGLCRLCEILLFVDACGVMPLDHSLSRHFWLAKCKFGRGFVFIFWGRSSIVERVYGGSQFDRWFSVVRWRGGG